MAQEAFHARLHSRVCLQYHWLAKGVQESNDIHGGLKQWAFTLNGQLPIGHRGLLASKAIWRYGQYAEEGFKDEFTGHIFFRGQVQCWSKSVKTPSIAKYSLKGHMDGTVRSLSAPRTSRSRSSRRQIQFTAVSVANQCGKGWQVPSAASGD